MWHPTWYTLVHNNPAGCWQCTKICCWEHVAHGRAMRVTYSTSNMVSLEGQPGINSFLLWPVDWVTLRLLSTTDVGELCWIIAGHDCCLKEVRSFMQSIRWVNTSDTIRFNVSESNLNIYSHSLRLSIPFQRDMYKCQHIAWTFVLLPHLIDRFSSSHRTPGAYNSHVVESDPSDWHSRFTDFLATPW